MHPVLGTDFVKERRVSPIDPWFSELGSIQA